MFGRQIRQALFSHVILRPCVLEDGFLRDLLQKITCTHTSEFRKTNGDMIYFFVALRLRA